MERRNFSALSENGLILIRMSLVSKKERKSNDPSHVCTFIPTRKVATSGTLSLSRRSIHASILLRITYTTKFSLFSAIAIDQCEQRVELGRDALDFSTVQLDETDSSLAFDCKMMRIILAFVLWIDLVRLEYLNYFFRLIKFTWVQRVGKFLYEVGDPHSGHDHRKADQLHGKIEKWLLLWIRRGVHQHHCQEPTPKNGRNLRQSHLGTL